MAIAATPLRVDDLITSPDGRKLAFLTNAINQRQEKTEDVEIYVVDLASVAPAPSPASSPTKLVEPRRITHNQAVETSPRWASDSRHILFTRRNRRRDRPLPRPAAASLLGRHRIQAKSSNGAQISSAPSTTTPSPDQMKKTRS